MSYYSYSGADFRVRALFMDSTIELLPVTVSVSTVHDKEAVRSLGYNYNKGFTNTVSEVRGTLIFNIIKNDPLLPLKVMQRETLMSYKFLDQNKRAANYNSRSSVYNWNAGDLEPFDLMLVGVTEGGELDRTSDKTGNLIPIVPASIFIRGIQITGTGQVISSHNALTEKTYSFRAISHEEIWFENGADLPAEVNNDTPVWFKEVWDQTDPSLIWTPVA